MLHPHRPARLPGTFEGAEDWVEIGVVVAGQIDPVRILVEETAVESQGVALDLEPALNGLEDRIHIHFLLRTLRNHFFQRGEAEVHPCDLHPFRRSRHPADAEQREDAEEEEGNLIGFHGRKS